MNKKLLEYYITPKKDLGYKLLDLLLEMNNLLIFSKQKIHLQIVLLILI